MKTVNAYLIKGDEVVLIDSGEHTKESYLALVDGLGQNGIKVQDLDRLILTHAHVDHIGMAERVADQANATVWVSEKVYDWAVDPSSKWDRRKSLMLPCLMEYFDHNVRHMISDGYNQMMGDVQKVWDPISKERIKIFNSEGQMEIDGKQWRVLYMPGHSATQSTFLHEESGAYLSADMLLRITPTPVIEPSLNDPSQREKGILQMLESYTRLQSFDIGTTYPGHYEIFDNAQDVILRQLNRIDQRVSQSLDIIKQGTNSFLDIFNVLYEGRFHMPALIMLIGYLDILEDQGSIQQVKRDGVLRIEVV